MKTNAKLHAPDTILADFFNGEPETRVIVILQPTAMAKGLADQSRMSAQVPSEFSGTGAATYYDLQDNSVRMQLQATVTETVNRVISQLGTTGMTVTQKFSYQFGFAAKVTPEALERIVNSSDVVAVEKDHILEAHLAQGIPLINADAVRSQYTGSGLSIAICDTGIDTSHPKLGGGVFPNSKVIGGYDVGDNDTDPRPNSVTGENHGTACAGIAAGNTGTVGDYIGGVAPDAKLYAIKISPGDTGSSSDSAMIAGWEWCIAHKNDDPNNPILIISTSFGGGRNFSTCDSTVPAMTTAAANAVAAGITVFAASGNNGYCDSMGWPACISYVNSVGAVYDQAVGTLGFCVSSASCATKEAHSGCSPDYVSWDSTASDMVTCYSNSASFLTLFAPSNQTYTTDIVGAGGASGDYVTNFGGTSAACPYAAGAAAVMQQAAKARTGAYLSPAEVKTYLVDNGDAITDGKVAVTKPRINLEKAVDALPFELSAPILAVEPAITPGTENTIYWSAGTDSTNTTINEKNSLAIQLITNNSSENDEYNSSGITNSPLNSAEIMLPANDTDGNIEPAQAIRPQGPIFVQQSEAIKPMSDITPLAATALLSESFEGVFPGTNWTLLGNPTWNDVSYDKHSGSWSGWCAGSSLNPANGYYADNMNSWMIYGPFSLSDATSAIVSFWYKNRSEASFDYFGWYASVDGVNFSGSRVNGDQNSWRSQIFDLSNVPSLGDLRGQSQVWIAFKFESDSSVSGYPGAYVDDIVITKESVPQVADLTPFQPSHWNDKISIGISQLAKEADHNYTGAYYDNQTLYFNLAWKNQGNVTTPEYTVHFEVTGTGGSIWNGTSLATPPNKVVALNSDVAIGPLAAGSHTFKVWIDYNNTISESNESNNYYERTITVSTTEPSYNAECDDNPDFSSPINSGWIMQTSTTFQNLTPGKTFWYRVKAKSAEVESNWSNIQYSLQNEQDTDEDGIPDNIEQISGTDPNNPDSDNDGITDGHEDVNHNGVLDNGETDPRLWDTDGDGASDGEEVAAGTNPLDPQSYPKSQEADIPLMGPMGYTVLTMLLGAAGAMRSRRNRKNNQLEKHSGAQ